MSNIQIIYTEYKAYTEHILSNILSICTENMCVYSLIGELRCFLIAHFNSNQREMIES